MQRNRTGVRDCPPGETITRAYEEEEETVIEDWDLEPVENDSNHLMIEAEEIGRAVFPGP